MRPVDSLLRRIGIEPEEHALCGWSGLCLLQIGATAALLLNSSETIFLKRVGIEYLPWALLGISGVLVITTGLTSHVLASADRSRWLPRALLVLALLLVPLWWALGASDSKGVFGAFLLVARHVFAIGLLVFWLALGDLVTSRQAKRLFAPLSACTTIGAIGGSFGTDPLARWLGLEGVVLIAAALLAGASFAALRLAGRGGPRRRHRGRAAPTRRSAKAGGRPSAVGLWSESPLFRILLVSMLCGGILSPVLFFEFSYIADAATQGPDGEQRLLSIYALFRGGLNAVLLFAQLWLSGVLYRRLGLPLSLALWPASYLLGFAGLGMASGLVTGVAALGAGRLTEDGIGGSAQRVLFNLFPERLRSGAAGLIEGPVNRIGGVFGNGCVIVAMALGLTTAIAWIALPLAGVWLGAVLLLWRRYPSLLLQASADRSLVGIGADKAKLLDRGTVRGLLPALIDPDPQVCRAAVDLVADAEPTVAAEVLAEATTSAPGETRALVVDALHRLVEPLPAGSLESPRAADFLAALLRAPGDLREEERADLLQTFARLTAGAQSSDASIAVLDRALGDPSAAVRLVAISELHRRRRPPPGVSDLDAVLRDSLGGRDVLMRRSARSELRAMLLSTDPDDVWRERLERLASPLATRADRAETAESLVEVARRHDGAARECVPRLVRLGTDRDPRVRAAVLRFVGHAGAGEHAHRLIAELGSRYPDVAMAAREGLVALGAEAAEPLLGERELSTRARRAAAMHVLRDLDLDDVTLEARYRREVEGIWSLVLLRAALEGAETAVLLRRRLEERIAAGIAAALALVSLREDDERVAELELRLRRARDDRSRDIVLEALEAVLPSDARAELAPLLEPGAWADRGPLAAERLGRRVPTESQAWSELQEDGDPLTVRLARGFAPEAVEERGGIGDASAVLDPMDVAVQLRSVPAFGRLSTRQLVSLAEVLESIPCASGAAVYSEGDEGDGLYFVLEGEVELLHAGEPIERVGPGGFFGELSTLDGVPRQESAHVRDTARLLRLEREELLAMMEEAPELGIGLCQFLSLRVRALREGGAPARASRPGPSP